MENFTEVKAILTELIRIRSMKHSKWVEFDLVEKMKELTVGWTDEMWDILQKEL